MLKMIFQVSKIVIPVIFLVFVLGCNLFASSLSTNFSDVYIENLEIGKTYNLTDSVNYKMWVNFKGESKTGIKISAVKPNRDDLKKGYESIPDTSWITFENNEFVIVSDKPAKTDVIINIPNDKKLLGKKYMAYIFISTFALSKKDAGLSIALGVKGKLYITIGSDTDISDRNKKEQSKGIVVKPEEFNIKAKRSKEIKITEQIPLKIINPSDEDAVIAINQVDPKETGMFTPQGYETGSENSLEILNSSFTLKASEIKNVDVLLKPSKKEWKSKEFKLFYVLKIAIKTKTLEISKYVSIYIN